MQRSIKPGKAASPKNVFSWMLLGDAHASITDGYQDRGVAERTLCKAFVELQVRNRAARVEDESGNEHNLRVGDLWRREYFLRDWRPYARLHINWHSSSATLLTKDAGRVKFYRIEVAREDVLKLLPEGYDLPQQQPAPAPQRKRGGGRPEQYDWDSVFAQFLRLVEDNGWPQIKNYRKFAKDVCDACAEAGMEPTPSVDTVREKISIWVSARQR